MAKQQWFGEQHGYDWSRVNPKVREAYDPAGHQTGSARQWWWPKTYQPGKHSPPPHPDFAVGGLGPKGFGKALNAGLEAGWHQSSYGNYEVALADWMRKNNISSKDAADAEAGMPQEWQAQAQQMRNWANQALQQLEAEVAPYKAKEEDLLSALQRRAEGEESIARQQAEIARQRGTEAIAGQAASALGRYSPAVAAAATRAQAEMAQGMAAPAALAAAQERAAAEQQYGQALGQRKAWEAGMEGLRQQLMGFGRGTAQDIMGQQLARQQMAQQMRQFQANMQQRQAMMEEQRRQRKRQEMMGFLKGGIGAFTGLAGMMGTMGGGGPGAAFGGGPPAQGFVPQGYLPHEAGGFGGGGGGMSDWERRMQQMLSPLQQRYGGGGGGGF